MHQRNLALAYLKACIITLVIAHHAMLAYALPPAVHFDPVHYLANTAPVMDDLRSSGFQVLVSVNDKFMMPLMFLISGRFVWPSRVRKGYRVYLRDRMLRLGLPFVLATTLLMPVAYFPAYLIARAHFDLPAYLGDYFSVRGYPLGPAWFLSVLLALDLALITTTASVPSSQRLLARLGRLAGYHPGTLFLALAVPSSLGFGLALFCCGPDVSSWVQFGPLAVQLTRLPIYVVYFLIGVGIGADTRAGRGLLAVGAVLSRQWLLWIMVGLTSALLYLGVSAGAPSLESWSGPPSALVTWALTVVLTGASLALASLSLAFRYAPLQSDTLDSLSQAAFGIYLMHYPFVTWMQYALLGVSLSAFAKGTITFAVALALSWATTAMLRRVPMVAKVL